MKRVLFLLIFLPAILQAASGDWLDPTQCAVIGTDWDGCSNTFVDDANRNSNSGINMEFFFDTTFNANVTAGATMDSLIARVKGYSDAAQQGVRRVTLGWIVDGSFVGDAITITLPRFVGSEAYVEARGLTDPLWNTGITAAQANDDGSGILVQKTSNNAITIFVNHVQIQYWFTEVTAAGRRIRYSKIVGAQ